MIKKILSLSLGLAACAFALPSSAGGCSPGQPCSYVTFKNNTYDAHGIQVYNPKTGKIIAVGVVEGKQSEGDEAVTAKLYFSSNEKNQKLLFMACSPSVNAVTGCEGDVTNRCPYPYSKKPSFNILKLIRKPIKPTLIACVNYQLKESLCLKGFFL